MSRHYTQAEVQNLANKVERLCREGFGANDNLKNEDSDAGLEDSEYQARNENYEGTGIVSASQPLPNPSARSSTVSSSCSQSSLSLAELWEQVGRSALQVHQLIAGAVPE